MSNSADRAEEDPTADVTRLLSDAAAGKSAATEELFKAVYDQLRQIAHQRMGRERPDHTLQATALVHEAYLRLVGDTKVHWQGRAHFFAAAAEAMRRILVERARQKSGPRRGGHLQRVHLDEAGAAAEAADRRLLLLDEALSELERHDAQAAALVKLRYFAGMQHQESADALGIGRRTADRLWALARAWLFEQISDG
ncbi:MAG: sigma-70 family RNA polymerase sigma factor [Phycisphaerales bacterium]|nr:MAG: sigma-70 family RNA polymerase sigma factor [Phycisphaerales bacterium]